MDSIQIRKLPKFSKLRRYRKKMK